MSKSIETYQISLCQDASADLRFLFMSVMSVCWRIIADSVCPRKEKFQVLFNPHFDMILNIRTQWSSWTYLVSGWTEPVLSRPIGACKEKTCLVFQTQFEPWVYLWLDVNMTAWKLLCVSQVSVWLVRHQRESLSLFYFISPQVSFNSSKLTGKKKITKSCFNEDRGVCVVRNEKVKIA